MLCIILVLDLAGVAEVERRGKRVDSKFYYPSRLYQNEIRVPAGLNPLILSTTSKTCSVVHVNL
jgi:hypothetical protein